MKAKEFIPAGKPRNFVAKNQKTAGAGAHKDKKRAEKQGDVKHKQKQFEQGIPKEFPKNKSQLGITTDRGPTWSFQEIAEKLNISLNTLTRLAFVLIKGFPEAISGLSSKYGSKKYYRQNEIKRWVVDNNVRERIKQGVAEGWDDEDEVDKITLVKSLQWPELVNKVNSAMKAMGWKGQRKDDGSFMFSTRGQLDDEWYIVVIDNRGNNMFTYALGTVEEGDPHIGDQESLPMTEASVSELMNAIREGFGLGESSVSEVSKATIDRYVTKASDAHGDADFKARMSKHDPDKRSYHVDQKKTAEKRRQGISRALDRMSREESVEEATSVAVRMQRAADKQRAKSDASLARTPSSIPKKDQEKKNG